VSSRKLKYGYFVLEGLNSFATVYYLYYIYFLMQQDYGFGKKANLVLAAWNGAVNAFGSWQGGRIAQRFGYFFTLKTGFLVMLVALGGGIFAKSAAQHVIAVTVMTFGMSLTWPTLEAMVSDGESAEGVQHMVGIYNIVWAATAALAYFLGGALIGWLHFKSIYYVPALMMAVQLMVALSLEQQAGHGSRPTISTPQQPISETTARPKGRGKTFLRMAWLANPFAYIAINTTIALVPSVAARFRLSTTLAGFYCAIWCFARLAAFYGLWNWDGWHYKFRWLLAAYVALIASFILMVSAPNISVLIVSQLFFGTALGLIYSSSLFYSMDLGDTKGEHGGLHEAAIGLGNFAGPAVGAASLHFLPQYANSGVFAVGVLLLLGLGGLFVIRGVGLCARHPTDPIP
jgi:predicted MFS family arabinose efflux permease